MCKHTYVCVSVCSHVHNTLPSPPVVGSDGGGATIGVLDMPGFENVRVNSFEQLCINVANEQLQQFFMQHIFVHERRACEQDGVKWQHVQHQDNQDIVTLFLQVTDRHVPRSLPSRL